MGRIQLGRELIWRQPSATKDEHELRDGDQLVATLRFKSALGTLATAETADGCWTFKRVGFWHPRVTIRECGAEADLAVFRNNTWSDGGQLDLPGGRAFRANMNFG